MTSLNLNIEFYRVSEKNPLEFDGVPRVFISGDNMVKGWPLCESRGGDDRGGHWEAADLYLEDESVEFWGIIQDGLNLISG